MLFSAVLLAHYSQRFVALPHLLLSHINPPVPRPAIVSVHITKQRRHFDVVIGQLKVSSYTPECQISSLASPPFLSVLMSLHLKHAKR